MYNSREKHQGVGFEMSTVLQKDKNESWSRSIPIIIPNRTYSDEELELFKLMGVGMKNDCFRKN